MALKKKKDFTLTTIVASHRHVIRIWALGNQYVFMTVAASRACLIATCDLLSRLATNKVNRTSQIHLMTCSDLAKKGVKIGVDSPTCLT